MILAIQFYFNRPAVAVQYQDNDYGCLQPYINKNNIKMSIHTRYEKLINGKISMHNTITGI